MTQAYNLSQFANKLNASGQTSNAGLQNSSVTVAAGTALSGGGPIALGSSATISHANSGVTANTYTAATITVNAQGHITAASSNTFGSGTVTSVATGNGLQGGTITTTGTLSVACPGFNTVGSYVGAKTFSGATVGANYAAGSVMVVENEPDGPNLISGTWKCMNTFQTGVVGVLFCRVA